MKEAFYKLVLVTQKKQQSVASYISFIRTCIQNGVTSVQLREKELSFDQLLLFGQALQSLLHSSNIPLIVNDNIDLAVTLSADGVHLGQNDGSIIEAREKLGSNKIIGLTVNSQKEVLEANDLPVDYIGISAIFPTRNKSDVQHYWNHDELCQAVSKSRHKIVAIGGINLKTAPSVLQAGIHGIAAISVFHDAANPAFVTKELSHLVNQETQYAQ